MPLSIYKSYYGNAGTGAEDGQPGGTERTTVSQSKVDMNMNTRVDSVNRMMDSMVTRNQRRSTRPPTNDDLSVLNQSSTRLGGIKRGAINADTTRDADFYMSRSNDQKRNRNETSRSPSVKQERKPQDAANDAVSCPTSQGPQGVKKNRLRRRASLTEYMKQLADLEAMNERHLKGSTDGC